MNVKVDENLPVEVAVSLREAGHDAMTVVDQRLGGQSDLNVANACRREARVLVTLDLDLTRATRAARSLSP